MSNLFAYGTLMFYEIIESITARTFKRQEAVLPGFVRFRVRNARYPGIIRKDGSEIKGRIFFNLDDSDLEKLDAYEGDIYERIAVSVTTPDGEGHDAYTFKVRDDRVHVLTQEDWDEEEFRKKNMIQFLREYRGLDSLA